MVLSSAALTALVVEAVEASRVGPQQENEGVCLRLTAEADGTDSVRFCRAGRGIVT